MCRAKRGALAPLSPQLKLENSIPFVILNHPIPHTRKKSTVPGSVKFLCLQMFSECTCSICCSSLVAVLMLFSDVSVPTLVDLAPKILKKQHRKDRRGGFLEKETGAAGFTLTFHNPFGSWYQDYLSCICCVHAPLFFASLPASVPSSPVGAHAIVSIWRAVFPPSSSSPTDKPAASQQDARLFTSKHLQP